MEKTIWKFELEITDNNKLEMPEGAKILSIQAQGTKPYLWVLVDPEANKETRIFEIFGTGHPINYGMGTLRNFIGTFQLRSGALVFHVFEYTGV